jgi:hypothetical protein
MTDKPRSFGRQNITRPGNHCIFLYKRDVQSATQSMILWMSALPGKPHEFISVVPGGWNRINTRELSVRLT